MGVASVGVSPIRAYVNWPMVLLVGDGIPRESNRGISGAVARVAGLHGAARFAAARGFRRLPKAPPATRGQRPASGLWLPGHATLPRSEAC